jgi:hypothetical protein
MLKARQLDLSLPLLALGSTGEYLKNKLSSVQYRNAPEPVQISLMNCRECLIEHNFSDLFACNHCAYFFSLTTANK